jgi:hypothetical protein
MKLFFGKLAKFQCFLSFLIAKFWKKSKLKFSFTRFFLKFQYVAKNIVRCWISFLNSCSHQFVCLFVCFFVFNFLCRHCFYFATKVRKFSRNYTKKTKKTKKFQNFRLKKSELSLQKKTPVLISPNLAKLSYGLSPLQLHHKIDQKN